jgi:hypothetical protein
MNTRWIVVALFVLLLAACASEPSPVPTPEPTLASPTDTPPPTAAATVPAAEPARPLPTERGELFSGSGTCTVCHANMVDEAGNNVSTDTFWRASMMANAARDPYWQASVRGEVISNPDYGAIIEDKCANCHMPMARFTAYAGGGQGKMLDEGFLDSANEWHVLAMDGVSCTLCHQIQKDGFGEPSSYSGGFVIDTDRPAGERVAFGPYPVDEALAAVMQGASGFVPLEGLHIEQSELCATCHTLYTPYIDAAGEIGGEFPEQMPYLEWLHGDYRETQSCQGCHMPEAQGGVRLSITGGDPRSPFRQHVFVGGNTYMLGMLNTFGEELQVTASGKQFADKGARVADQLKNRTATVTVQEAALSGAALRVRVAVESQVGHKFPSGFPARRAWLHLSVRDGDGQKVFDSGAVNRDGSIGGNDNDADPSAYEPHYRTIESPDQVQIYESIMEDSEGEVTTILLGAARYVKDNRLLPAGFDKGAAREEIAVQGRALEDEDFLGGSDGIEYAVDVGDAQGPFTVTVELLYQSIGYRWADNLRRYDSPETARFLGYYDTLPNLPIVVASETVEVE